MPLRIRCHVVYPKAVKPKAAPVTPPAPSPFTRDFSKRRFWTPAEDETLARNLGSHTYKELGTLLKRTEGSIQARLRYLGLVDAPDMRRGSKHAA